jgi:general secretion pathway protein D
MRVWGLPQSKTMGAILLLVAVVVSSCASPELRKADGYAEHGEWDKAVEAYREAAKKEPFSETVQSRMGLAKTRAAERHYEAGRRALDADRLPDAVQEFKLALGFDPSKPEHHAAMTMVLRLKEARDQMHTGEKLQGLGRLEEALAAFERAIELDASLSHASDGITEITKQQRAAKMIGGSLEPITLRFQNAKLREVFEIVARTAGVNVIFDKEVRDDPITIFIKQLPFDEALDLILNTNGLVAQRVAADTILVMPNNKQKQAQYQDLLMRTFYLSNAKAKDAVNMVRTLLDSKKIYVDEKVNAIVVRDEPAKLQLAERLLFAIDRREPEVELDLEVLEVNRTKSLKYGLNYAKQAGYGLRPPSGTGGISTAPTTWAFEALTSLGAGSYLFLIPSSVLIDFFKQDSDAKTLASPKLRVLNNKTASINVGDKQPILLSTTNVLPGQAATGAVPTTSTVTSIEFKDTGVKLTVEPSINLVDEVTLKLKVEVTRLGDQVTLQASPEIKQFKFGTRMAETVLMLKDDETVVLAGLIQDEERKNRSSVPLIGDIPWLGQLFTSTTTDRVATEVVLTITPRIVRSMTAPPIAQQAFWSGTESTYATEQLFPPRPSAVKYAASKSSGDRVVRPAAEAGAGMEGVSVPDDTAATSDTPSPGGRRANDELAGKAPLSTRKMPARVMGGLSLNPEELTAAVGQEFRLDLVTSQAATIGEAGLTVSYDPQTIEFMRVVPGAASISARAADGQVVIAVNRQAPGGAGEAVLAMLFFHAKVPGDSELSLRTIAAAGSSSEGGEQPVRQAVVHVQ